MVYISCIIQIGIETKGEKVRFGEKKPEKGRGHSERIGKIGGVESENTDRIAGKVQ